MDNYSNQITDYLLTQSWQIAVLVVLVATANLALKNRSAHIRYLLWLIVLAKCLVPPFLTVSVAVLPEEKAMIVFVPPESIAVEPVEASTPEAPAPSDPAVVKHTPRFTIRQWLAVGWIVGASVFVLAALAKALRTELWLRRVRKPLPAGLQSEIKELFSCLDIRISPKLWLIDGIGQPFVWGILRGGIYLPANFVKVNSAEQRRGILGHELSHVLRFDAAVNLLQVMAQAIFWFHPFVWWANRKIRAEREKCCDEMAIARLGAKVRDYSIAIVNILICEHESTRPVPSLAIAGPVKNIEERIKTMLKPGKRFHKRPSLAGAIGALLIALVTIPTAIVLTARGQAQPIAQSADKLGADGEKLDKPRFAARTFNAKTPFRVYAQETPGSMVGGGLGWIGDTPSAAPLEIPACYRWYVRPLAPVQDWDLLVQEMKEKGVPGLELDSAPDSDMQHLRTLTELQDLYLWGTEITDAGLGHLKGLSGLRSLQLSRTQITDAGLSHLKGLTRLQELNLMYTRITDAGLAHLEGLPGLGTLYLSNTQVTDTGLAHLEGLPGLRTLYLSDTQVTDAGLVHIKRLNTLEGLYLRNTKITDAGLQRLKDLAHLKELDLSETQVTDAGMEPPMAVTKLQQLWLMGTSITDAGVRHLRGLTTLQGLDLGATKITDAGLEHLKGLTGLRRLDLYMTQVTDAGVEHLKNLTRCQQLDLSGTQVTDMGLAHLKGLTGLQNLGLTNTKITDAGLTQLKGLTELRRLQLSATKTGDPGLEHLKGLANLQWLQLDQTQVTDAGLTHLKGLSGLRRLDLSYVIEVTDAGIEQLEQNLPNLTINR